MKKLIAFILSTSLSLLPLTVKAVNDVKPKDNSVCVNNYSRWYLNETVNDCRFKNVKQESNGYDFCWDYKYWFDKFICFEYDFEYNPCLPQKPENKPTQKPENVPEQNPQQNPEQKPENESDNESDVGQNSGYVNRVISLVNQERAKAGLASLVADLSLNKVALVRAKETVKMFSHTRPNGKSCFSVLDEYGIKYSGAGENIAYGQTSPEQVVNDWMNSQGHRENILNPNYTKIGVGCYNNGSTLHWAQMFTY